MPLKNPRYERFAQELAAGKTARDAYVQAGFRDDPRGGNAAKLAAKPDLAARVQEIVAAAAQKAGVTVNIRSLARAHTPAAINTLAGIMNEPEAPPAARVSAATALLDRGWGKPTQPIAGDDGADPLTLAIIKRVIVEPPGNPDGSGVPPAA